MPEEQMLKLSDAFENKEVRADVELTVRMLNINCGHNRRLMDKCKVLEEFDAEKYERTLRREGREEGKGIVNRLGILLTEAGRSNDFLKSLSDREFQRKLFVEFGLEDEK